MNNENTNKNRKNNNNRRIGNGGGLMLHRKAVLVTVAGAIIFALLAYNVFASAAAAGSTADPIALKSYVDSKLEAMEIKLTLMINALSDAGDADGAGGAGGAGAITDADSADIAALVGRIDELSVAVDRLREENSALRRSMRQLSESMGIDAGDIGVGAVYDEEAESGRDAGLEAFIPGGADTNGGAGTGSGAGAGGGAGAGSGVGGGAAAGTGVGTNGSRIYADHFTAVEVFANQRVIFGAGAEMVLRTGGAQAIRGEHGALVDLISGRDFEAGENVPLNHLILSPRDDNRGIRISDNAWILIRGPYEIR
ncbi:MAG: hypothetical protein FWH01_13670 [Oscillospiraceae bacterium]|nr:hypothetical protein [Oscillospiraceae bacterium]